LAEKFLLIEEEKQDWEEKDIFYKYKQLAIWKLDVFGKYPEMFNFLKNAYLEDNKEVKPEIDSRAKELLYSSYQSFFSEIDYSKFKDEIDAEKAVHIIYWSMEGYLNQFQDRIR